VIPLNNLDSPPQYYAEELFPVNHVVEAVPHI